MVLIVRRSRWIDAAANKCFGDSEQGLHRRTSVLFDILNPVLHLATMALTILFDRKKELFRKAKDVTKCAL